MILTPVFYDTAALHLEESLENLTMTWVPQNASN